MNQQSTQLFTQDFSVHESFSDNDDVECYYLQNADNTMVVGWVHNRHAWTTNNFYLASSQQNILGCLVPNSQTVWISGLEEGPTYYVNWFPTRMNTTECPADAEDDDGDDLVILEIDDPASAAFGGTLNNYLDTLHVDYAFIITPEPLVKSLLLPPQPEVSVDSGWDFALYPNPTRGELYLRLTDDKPKDVMIHDLSGRQIRTWSSVTGPIQHLPMERLANGAYWVRVSDGHNSKVRKVIIH